MNRLYCQWLSLILITGVIACSFDFGRASPPQASDEAKQKADDARRKAESAKKKADDAVREAARLADEAKRAEEAVKPSGKKKDDSAKKSDDAKKKEDDQKKSDDAKKAESAKKKADDAAKAKAADEDAKRKADAAKSLDGLTRDRDGYALLFNGKDLANWYLANDSKTTLDGKTETAEKHYSVHKDVLAVSGAAKGSHSLRSVKQLSKRFQTKFDFRVVNDGVCNVNIGGYGFALRDFSKPNPSKSTALKSFKPGDWNSIDVTIEMSPFTANTDLKQLTEKDAIEVSMKDGVPTLRVNGKAVEANHFQFHRNPVAIVKCNGEEIQKGGINFNGAYQISLRPELGKVEVRNFRVKEVN